MYADIGGKNANNRVGGMSDCALFDEDTFGTLTVELGLESTAEVLAAFLRDTRAKIGICTARTDDRALIEREAHSIKSSAGTFGFIKLSTVARNLEKNVPNLDPDKVEESIADLRAAFEATSRLAQGLLALLEKVIS